MASVMAIVSKALFEKMVPKGVQPGAVVDIDRYKSAHKAFAGLSEGDAIFLVTVRPPDEALWLIGVLESPERTGDDWIARANGTPIVDVCAAIPKLVFESGAGLVAKKGALGMSLQTPRVLAEGDVALLRGLVGGSKASGQKLTASAAYRDAVDEVIGSRKKKADKTGKKTAKKGGLRLARAFQPFKGKAKDLKPWEEKQLGYVASHEAGSSLDAMFGGDIEEDFLEAWIVDVVDEGTSEPRYQLHLFGYGDGNMFAHGTDRVVAGACQHGFEAEEVSDAVVRELGAAWARDAKKLGLWPGHIDFDEDDE